MRKFKKLSLLLTSALLFAVAAFTQVTTGSIGGSVKDNKDQSLIDATVIAKHIPTGTSYTVTSRQNGRFDIPNVIPGGPYSLTVSYIGFKALVINDIAVPLGDKFEIAVVMNQSDLNLSEIVVSGTKSANQKTGAGSNFSRRQITNMPNVSRSLTSVTRATPQANGNSFAGMNYRYNNLTIDGSLFNNNFGRSGDGFVPGGAVSAISIDAIDQLQVNIAPYDVRQAGFIGGGVNAVTRRGTNNWYGTAYSFYRDQSFNGTKVLSQNVTNQPRKTQIYGGSIGGPIIKNKLFFFVNAEYEERTNPGQTWLAKRPGVNDNNPQVTPVLASDLESLSNYLSSTYKLNVGSFENYNFQTSNFKILGRIDWNIDSKNKFSFRFTRSNTDDDDQINTSSTSGLSASSINNGRRGGLTGGLGYQTSNFKNNVKVLSGVAELNSSFTSKISNQLIVSYTSNKLKRIPYLNTPFVDIMSSSSNVYISFGTELFSYLNSINDQAWNFADNVTMNFGKHSITAGASFEKMYFNNSFTGAGGPAYYRYASLADFIGNKAPSFFAVAYDPTNPKGIKVPEAKFDQLGIYIQDAWTASEKFKLTYGLRVDQPFYPFKPDKNNALGNLTFKDENGVAEQFDVSTWPKSRLLFSPRVGFNYDVIGDKSLIIRGGTGLFTGRIPFIWFVNQVGDNGVVRAVYTATTAELANIKYNTDRTTYIPTNPPPVGTTTSSGTSYSGVDKNFKMPQVWRTNLAFDKNITSKIVLSMEGIVTKIINNAYFRNANLGDQTSTLGGVADNRPVYTRRLNANADRMSILDNTNKGWSAAFTVGLQRNFNNNFEASLFYTYTQAYDVAIGTSDQSASSWQTNNIAGNPNKPEIGFSNFSVPHRIVAAITKKFEYINKKYATTVNLFYSASPQERYSYRYASDINGDGATNDIIYVPKNPSEIKFVEGFKVGSTVYSAAAQSEAFFKFIANDPYLRKHQGQYMDRYAGLLPWFHSLDARVLQDFNFNVKGKKHTIQLSADIINLLNLLNSKWGYRYSYTYGTFQDMGILGIPSSTNNTGAESFRQIDPKFTFNPAGALKGYQPNYSTSSTWGLQLGLRYIFN